MYIILLTMIISAISQIFIVRILNKYETDYNCNDVLERAIKFHAVKKPKIIITKHRFSAHFNLDENIIKVFLNNSENLKLGDMYILLHEFSHYVYFLKNSISRENLRISNMLKGIGYLLIILLIYIVFVAERLDQIQLIGTMVTLSIIFLFFEIYEIFYNDFLEYKANKMTIELIKACFMKYRISVITKMILLCNHFISRVLKILFYFVVMSFAFV